jgi:hypothetical protein
MLRSSKTSNLLVLFKKRVRTLMLLTLDFEALFCEPCTPRPEFVRAPTQFPLRWLRQTLRYFVTDITHISCTYVCSMTSFDPLIVSQKRLSSRCLIRPYRSQEITLNGDIRIYSDSQLVVEQINGNWRIEDQDLKPPCLASGPLAPTRVEPSQFIGFPETRTLAPISCATGRWIKQRRSACSSVPTGSFSGAG